MNVDEQLLITYFNVAASVSIQLNYRLYNLEGQYVEERSRAIALNTTGTATSIGIRAGGGRLQLMAVYVVGGAPSPGDTYVEVGVLKGDIITRTLQSGILMAGYLTATSPLYFGGSPSLTKSNPFGVLTQIGLTGAVPVGFNIPTGRVYKLHHITGTYTTDANVADRYVNIIMVTNPGGVRVAEWRSKVAQAASLTFDYTLSPEVADSTAAVNLWVTVGVPELVIPAGWAVSVNPVNRQGGDSVAFQLWFETWVYP